ncbi:hypothetical protein [Lachnoclostridium sp. Marseille-P6806]|uniref:hypothetical protein n=1 Tax=Lachnoclostridium sp. Marseille-P6806 TaxID=2364793 RepID=UPI0013EF53D7|nr:hypothetical protein [Lachnoclostridium sp. Marseille-P6806]
MLAERIDYWLKDDFRRINEAERYKMESEKYDIHHSVKRLQQMYRDAIQGRLPVAPESQRIC